MGTCGCGDFYSEQTLDLGGGMTLSLDRYCGCGECATPIGVRLAVLDKQGADEWLYDHQYPPKESLVPGQGDCGVKEHWVCLPLAIGIGRAVIEHGWPNLFTVHIHKHYHGKDEMI